MKAIYLLLVFLVCSLVSDAQPAILEHSSNCYTPQIILFSANGTKYLEQRNRDTLNFYNTDHSFWKRIVIPPIPGCGASCGVGNVYGISDHLFNSDDSVEYVVSYEIYSSAHWLTRILTESGTMLQEVDSAADGGIHYVDGLYKLITIQGYGGLGSMDSTRYYQLPGSLPCGHCGGSLGVENLPANNGSGATSLRSVPNPSAAQVRIYYELPTGIQQGAINLYNANGQLIKTFTVTNTFTYITLDNSELPTGVYYYNLTGNGIIPSGNKMVIVR